VRVIRARNVNEAYRLGMDMIRAEGISEQSRNGPVWVMPEPVTTVYEKPYERVLFDPVRDANPFFHCAEIVWMMAGTKDPKFLDTYVHDFSERYAEADGNMHGAYGERWFTHFAGTDQITKIGNMLLDDATTRRAVLTMWDPRTDLAVNKRDIPCNTHAYFRGRHDHLEHAWYLDMTVLCRSNDMIWGAYGANAVHMSAMMEVVAGLAGMRMGRYYQVSNNFHAYSNILGKLEMAKSSPDLYRTRGFTPAPIVAGNETVASFLSDCVLATMYPERTGDSYCQWMRHTWDPMRRAHELFKEGARSAALSMTTQIDSQDWREACEGWITRRLAR
jgi:hypothetical protein